MEWLVSTTEFKSRDRQRFSFNNSCEFKAVAIRVQGKGNGEVEFQHWDINTTSEYRSWIESCRPPFTGPHRPTLILVMHRRVEPNENDVGSGKKVALVCHESLFQSVCKDLCQHRTLGSIIARVSTAIFSSRPVVWKGSEGYGHSTVYHCKSDTESLGGEDDIVLSTTSFTDVPITFGTLYGCTETVVEFTKLCLKRCQDSAFHPLVLPIIFAEHERKRLLHAVDLSSTELEARILDLEKRVNTDKKKEVKQHAEKGQAKQTMTQRDCEAIKLWRSMSRLKNGLESLHTELGSMKDHLCTISDCVAEDPSGSGRLRRTDLWRTEGPEVHINARLKEMMAELRSKIRSCEGLLGSMTLATQMEWNHYTRLDAQVNFGIATATRMDSSQMKQISKLGMIFLPGTFLATFFSMTFFTWVPEDSSPKASPGLALYVGLTVLLTLGTMFWFRKRSTIEDARKSVKEDMAKDIEASLFSGVTFRSSSSSGDLEKGVPEG